MLEDLEQMTDEKFTFKARMSKMGKRKMIMVPMALYDMVEREDFDNSLLRITLEKIEE